jgi:hypothetical protein
MSVAGQQKGLQFGRAKVNAKEHCLNQAVAVYNF